MKPYRKASTSPVSRLFVNFRRRQRIAQDFKIIEQLPDRVRRDIGWPPYGDLDERAGY